MENEDTADNMITIKKETYDRLIKDSKRLSALEGAGVDNWEGYDYAMKDITEDDFDD